MYEEGQFRFRGRSLLTPPNLLLAQFRLPKCEDTSVYKIGNLNTKFILLIFVSKRFVFPMKLDRSLNSSPMVNFRFRKKKRTTVN